MTPAVFLDRDGTLIDDPGFLGDPAEVRLLPGVAAALNRLANAGYRLVVVTNQSGIGRGLLTEEQVAAVHAEIGRQLGDDGVCIDAWYHCPHHPEAGCACRKPGTALHQQAATAFTIDLERSWCLGDRITDLLPCARLGGRAILVLTGDGAAHRAAAETHHIPVAADLGAAADLILG